VVAIVTKQARVASPVKKKPALQVKAQVLSDVPRVG
jgi:hypothetical protein